MALQVQHHKFLPGLVHLVAQLCYTKWPKAINLYEEIVVWIHVEP